MKTTVIDNMLIAEYDIRASHVSETRRSKRRWNTKRKIRTC